MISKRFLRTPLVIAIPLAVLVLFLFQAVHAQETAGPQIDHVQEGVKAFDEAFYHLEPKGKRAQASQKYGQAIGEFKKAIEFDENNVEAHLRLARVYYVQKRFSQAAEEYKKVTALTPYDVNAYLKLALAYERLGRYPDAIKELEKAKGYTENPLIINILDDLIKKLR